MDGEHFCRVDPSWDLFSNLCQIMTGILSDQSSMVSPKSFLPEDALLLEEMAVHENLWWIVENERVAWKAVEQKIKQMEKEERDRQRKRKAMAKEQAGWGKEKAEREKTRKAAGLSDTGVSPSD